MKWTIEMIRNEIKQIDKQTKLNGALLPIKLTRSVSVLGCFNPQIQGGGGFSFSSVYFEDDQFNVKSAIDVIRHEYAHYMDFIIYGKCGHGATWKKCCSVIGAVPRRIYSPVLNALANEKEKRDKELNEILELYEVGDFIKHPIFGKGEIISTDGTGVCKCMDVKFLGGTKTLTARWVNDYCEIL